MYIAADRKIKFAYFIDFEITSAKILKLLLNIIISKLITYIKKLIHIKNNLKIESGLGKKNLKI